MPRSRALSAPGGDEWRPSPGRPRPTRDPLNVSRTTDSSTRRAEGLPPGAVIAMSHFGGSPPFRGRLLTLDDQRAARPGGRATPQPARAVRGRGASAPPPLSSAARVVSSLHSLVLAEVNGSPSDRLDPLSGAPVLRGRMATTAQDPSMAPRLTCCHGSVRTDSCLCHRRARASLSPTPHVTRCDAWRPAPSHLATSRLLRVLARAGGSVYSEVALH